MSPSECPNGDEAERRARVPGPGVLAVDRWATSRRRPPASGVFGDGVPAATILDRLHPCEVISLNGGSRQLNNRAQAVERNTDAA